MSVLATKKALHFPQSHGNVVYIIESDIEHKTQLECLLIHTGLQVFSYDCAEEFHNVMDSVSPGVVLLALRLRGQSGLHLQDQLKHRSHLVTVMMSSYGYVEFAVKALKNGAANFIEKPLSQSSVLSAIWGALDLLHEQERKRCLLAKVNNMLKKLSSKERMVVDHLAIGLDHRTIAEMLCLSPTTVDLYRTKIKKKLNLKRMSHLIILITQTGLVKPNIYELEGLISDL